MPPPRQRRRTTGGRTTRWCVSVQGAKGRKAHGSWCLEGFLVGEWRVAAAVTRPMDSTSHAGHKWLHLTCVDGPLPAATGIEGYTQLAVNEREDLEAALVRRAGLVLPLQEPDAAQALVPPPAEGAAVAGAGLPPAEDQGAYGPSQPDDPLQDAAQLPREPEA